MKLFNLIKFIFSLMVLTPFMAAAQNGSFARWDEQGLYLDNGVVSRYISFHEDGVRTISLRIPTVKQNFVLSGISEPDWILNGSNKMGKGLKRTDHEPLEFSFTLDDKPLTGLSGWEVKTVQTYSFDGGKGAILTLEGPCLNLKITYLLYPELPVIRKKITVTNLSGQEVKLENFDVESLNIHWENTHNMIYQNYTRYRRIGPFVGDWDDPVVVTQDEKLSRGIILGNESPGVLKRTSVCLDGISYAIGLTHSGQDYPFRVWLQDGEKWESPWTFIIPYQGVDPTQTMEGPLDDFIREYLGIRLARLDQKPTFVYNTWNPFRQNINEKLIMELADAAAACGVEEFVIDDGWQNNRGDWEVDRKKFPNGLKPVFDYIKSKGMKPGLWIALSTVSIDSRVYKEHPEWCVRYKDGKPMSVHSMGKHDFTTCMASGWKEYIKQVILKHVKENGLQYVKLDLAMVTSAYMFDRSRSGCYAKGHSHKDREESLLEIYRNAWQLFDELHTEAPGLFIDCTFETMGALQMIDLDMCKHAEGNWLSNFEEPASKGSLRVRQMGWWRSGIIPATALVIGNQTMDGPNWEMSFQSLLGSLPIMLGDPRKVNPEDQQKMKSWSDWMKAMQGKFNYMMFKQDLPDFGEPVEGGWDGWARINTQTKEGGIVGVFRQGSFENTRKIRLPYLDTSETYLIREAPSGKLIQTLKGSELSKDGFTVVLNKKYEAKVYSISLE